MTPDWSRITLPALNEAEQAYLDEHFRDSLAERGYQASLEVYLSKWRVLGERLSQGQGQELSSFTNNLDIRSHVERILDSGPPTLEKKIRPLLMELDETFLKYTVQANRQVMKGDPISQFWINRVPAILTEDDYLVAYRVRGLI
jgi:hypothetical protein